MAGLAQTRLVEERKQWRKDHPFGFFAKPVTLADGSLDMMRWECGIPGKAGTAWENGLYKLTLTFSDQYPAHPPKCVFIDPLPHPNIFPSGAVCLSIIGHDWKPSITLKQILLGIQDLLSNPNLKSPANGHYHDMLRNDKAMWERAVRKFAAKHAVTFID